jgi:hypothetical protein
MIYDWSNGRLIEGNIFKRPMTHAELNKARVLDGNGHEIRDVMAVDTESEEVQRVVRGADTRFMLDVACDGIRYEIVVVPGVQVVIDEGDDSDIVK